MPGGEEYSDSIQLGLLDALESLRWIQNNIKAFGGNPDNVTIFGESAGSGIVSCLLATEYAGELFQRAIAESGALNQTNTRQEASANNQAEILMQLAGAETMADLLALTEEQLIELNEWALDEEETCLNDLYSIPFRGDLVPEDAYAALANAKARGVDLLIGTNADETHYWITEMGGMEIQDMTDEEREACIAAFEEYFLDPMLERMMDKLSEADQAHTKAYMALHSDVEAVWQKAMVASEYMFRASSIRMAECYSEAEGSGKTYMYLFGKTHSDYACMGACHAAELSYVFHNLTYNGFSGATDEALADEICSAWVNFARTGGDCTTTLNADGSISLSHTGKRDVQKTRQVAIDSVELVDEEVCPACESMAQFVLTVIPKHVHSYEKKLKEGVEQDCEKGLIYVYSCECGDVQEVTAYPEHSWTPWEATGGDCGNGIDMEKTCLVCGKKQKERVSSSGHEDINDDGICDHCYYDMNDEVIAEMAGVDVEEVKNGTWLTVLSEKDQKAEESFRQAGLYEEAEPAPAEPEKDSHALLWIVMLLVVLALAAGGVVYRKRRKSGGEAEKK